MASNLMSVDTFRELSYVTAKRYKGVKEARKSIEEAYAVAIARIAELEASTEKEFKELAAKWEGETTFLSSSTDKSMNKYYQQIIGLGPAVVPFLLEDLRDYSQDPPHWFWALRSITRDDPVPVGDRGMIVKMAQSWVSWGIENGHIEQIRAN